MPRFFRAVLSFVRAVWRIVFGIVLILVAASEIEHGWTWASEAWQWLERHGVVAVFMGVGGYLASISLEDWVWIIGIIVLFWLIIITIYDRSRERMEREYERDLQERLGGMEDDDGTG